MSAPTFNDAQEMFDAITKRIAEREETMKRMHLENEADRNTLYAIEEFLRIWRAAHGIAETEPTQTPAINPPPRRRKPRNPDRAIVVEKVRELIQTAEHPLSRADLFTMLANKGIEIQGKDPQMVLSTMLWRSQDRVVRLGNNGYWLTEQPYEPLNYDPKIDDLMGVARSEPDGDIVDEDDANE